MIMMANFYSLVHRFVYCATAQPVDLAVVPGDK